MMIKSLNICYNPTHQPFQANGSTRVENVESSRPASKVLRAVLRGSAVDPIDWQDYSFLKCQCGDQQGQDRDTAPLNSDKTMEELGIGEGQSLFTRKVDEKMEMQVNEKEKEMQPETQSNEEEVSPLKRPSSDEPESSSPSKRSKTSPTLSKPLSIESTQLIDLISLSLGGSAWKEQHISHLGCIRLPGAAYLATFADAIKAALEHPEAISEQRESGFLPQVLIKALVVSNLALIADISSSFRVSHVTTADLVAAQALLASKKPIEGYSRDEEFNESLGRLGLRESSMKVAKKICVLWNNASWPTQKILVGFEELNLSLNNLGELLKLAKMTSVESGKEMVGYPPLALKFLREAISTCATPSASSSKSKKEAAWPQKRSLQVAGENLKTKLNQAKAKALASSIPSSNASTSSSIATSSKITVEETTVVSDSTLPTLDANTISTVKSLLELSSPSTSSSSSSTSVKGSIRSHLEESRKILNSSSAESNWKMKVLAKLEETEKLLMEEEEEEAQVEN